MSSHCSLTRHLDHGFLIVLLLLVSSFVNVFAHDTGSNQHTLLPKIVKPIVFFENKEYSDLDDLKVSLSTKSKDVNERWLRSSNIATFADIKGIEYVTIPITLNIAFIGFEGGNHDFVMHDDDLQLWFEHIEHQIDIYKLIESHNHHHNRPYPLKYSISFRLIKLSSLVNTVIENEILRSLRHTIPLESEEEHSEEHHENLIDEDDYVDHYVDSYQFSNLMKDLKDSISLDDSYTLFIMNPKSPFTEESERYGYRYGFSNEEIAVLYGNKIFKIDKPKKKKSIVGSSYTDISKIEAFPRRRKSDEILEIDFLDKSQESEKWANNKILSYVQKNDKEFNNEDIMEYAKYIAKYGDSNQKDYLSKVVHEKDIKEECIYENWLSNERFSFIDLSAGPFEWGNLLSGFKTKNYLPRVPTDDILTIPQEKKEMEHFPIDPDVAEEWKDLQEIFIKKLEKEYEMECADKEESERCKILRERNLGIKRGIQDLSGHEHEQENIIENPGLSSVDDFMSRISSVVYKTINSLYARQLSSRTLTLTPKVTFSVIHIKLSDQLDYDPLEHFDIVKFKEELFRLKLPNQEFSFEFKEADAHHVTILRDKIHKFISLKPYIKIVGKDIISERILTLDTKSLRDDLDFQFLSKTITSFAKPDHTIVPIFLLSFKDKKPILLDNGKVSKSDHANVFIIQSDNKEWISRFTCNGKNIVWDLRNPIGEALQETARFYGGLIPTYSIYDESNVELFYDYLWSAGKSVMSLYLHNHQFSQIHIDAVHRNLLITSLENVISELNHGVHLLYHIKTSLIVWEVYDELNLMELRNYYEKLVNLINEIRLDIAQLYFGSAYEHMLELNQVVNIFLRKCHNLRDVTIIYHCVYTDHERDSWYTWILPIALIIDVFLIIIYFMIKDRSIKLKEL